MEDNEETIEIEGRDHNVLVKRFGFVETREDGTMDIGKRIATRSEMADLVEMKCGKCGNAIKYFIGDDCPSCGMIRIECKTCGYKFWFGE